MRRLFTSKIALTSQLFALSAGLSFALPSQDPEPTKQATADSKTSRASDRELSRKIHEALVADKNLSASARSVRIMSHEGNVTLKGKVKSEDEKKAIEDKAVEVAGTGKVTNDLVVGSN
jgi:osmotically-inducible protein OsmY